MRKCTDTGNWLERHVRYASGDDVKRLAAEHGYTIGPVYHGTSEFFDVFSITNDIGFHFGTKAAANSRKRMSPQYSVSEELPSNLELLCTQIEAGTFKKQSPSDELFEILVRKLDFPSKDRIEAEIRKMEASEISDLIAEYGKNPDSVRFAERAERGRSGIRYKVDAGGISEWFDDKQTMEMFLEKMSRKDGTGAYFLTISDPIEIPDLGVWPAGEVAEECGFSNEEIGRVMDSADKYGEIISILESKGHSGLVYENLVEDPGSISYIVFHPWQIKLADVETFDDMGKPIPYDKRFDQGKDDVRY